MKNFDASICITFGYIVSPEKMTMAEIPMIPTYEIKRRTFFLVEIEGDVDLFWVEAEGGPLIFC